MPPEVRQAITLDRLLNVAGMFAAALAGYILLQVNATAKDLDNGHNLDVNAHPKVLIDVATMKAEVKTITNNVIDMKEDSRSLAKDLKDMKESQTEFQMEVLRRLPQTTGN